MKAKTNINSSKWILAGAIILFVTAVGHLFFVDVSLHYFLGTVVSTDPVDIIEQMSVATYDWGIFGKNGVLAVFTGLSIWLSISLVLLALWSLAVINDPTQRITSSVVCTIGACAFAAISYVCFIGPPFLGGLAATFCYGRAYFLERGRSSM